MRPRLDASVATSFAPSVKGGDVPPISTMLTLPIAR